MKILPFHKNKNGPGLILIITITSFGYTFESSLFKQLNDRNRFSELFFQLHRRQGFLSTTPN